MWSWDHRTGAFTQPAIKEMTGGKGMKAAVIVLDDSEEEEEEGEKDAEQTTNGGKSKADVSSALRNLLGDRAEMERERLQRRRKRRRDEGLQSDSETEQVTVKGENKRPKASASTASTESPMYWHGTVKKSYNVYSPATPGTRFEEFIRPTTPARANGLTHVLMATYCEDIQWLAGMFPRGVDAPEITMITLGQGELKPGVYAPLHPQLPNWIRLVISRKGLTEWTTMHMKFLLLFYPDRLRLILLSGNMVEYDWSRIENTAFIHDFHRLDGGETDESSGYYKAMHRVLSSLSVPSGHHAMRCMSQYDMSTDCEARLVVSMPTVAPISGWNAIEEVGIGRLAKVVGEILGDDKAASGSVSRRMTIEAQGSSMGTYSPRWMQHMHIICSGLDYRRLVPLPTATAKANSAWARATGCSETDKWPPIRLLFPSDNWVKTQAIEGVPGAGTFFGKRKASVEKGFVGLIHQPVSVRGNVMMHHKAILAVREGTDVVRWPSDSQQQRQSTLVPAKKSDDRDDDNIVGWAYMGSHNLTQAAWGSITQPKQASSAPQMTIGNWELGIVLPVRARDLQQRKEAIQESMAANIITWKRPCERYSSVDVPWDQFAQSQ